MFTEIRLTWEEKMGQIVEISLKKNRYTYYKTEQLKKSPIHTQIKTDLKE